MLLIKFEVNHLETSLGATQAFLGDATPHNGGMTERH